MNYFPCFINGFFAQVNKIIKFIFEFQLNTILESFPDSYNAAFVHFFCFIYFKGVYQFVIDIYFFASFSISMVAMVHSWFLDS